MRISTAGPSGVPLTIGRMTGNPEVMPRNKLSTTPSQKSSCGKLHQNALVWKVMMRIAVYQSAILEQSSRGRYIAYTNNR